METWRPRTWAVAAISVAVGASTATALLALGGQPVIAHAGATPASVALAAAAVLLLISASAVCLSVRPLWTMAALLALMAATALAPVWVGWQSGPPFVRAVASVVAVLLPSLAFTVALIEPGGAMHAERWAVVAVGASLILGTFSVAFRDPFMDVQCWNDCTAGTAFAPWQAGGVLATTGMAFVAVALAVGAVALQAARVRRADTATRVWVLAVGAPASFVSVTLAAHAVLSHTVAGERTGDSRYAALDQATWIGLMILAVGAGAVAVEVLHRRRLARALIDGLGRSESGSGLRAACVLLLGDPGVHVAYWVPSGRCFVDADGTALGEPPGPSTIEVRRAGDLMAVVSTTRDVGSGGDVLQRLGSAAAIGLENERLQAELEFHLAQVIASRRRIVESATEARRSLERDLHDSVQGGIVALLYAISAAGFAGGSSTSELMEHASRIAERLRMISHGIHPSVVDEMGLANALDAIGDSRAVRIVVDDAVNEAPATVATAAYEVVLHGADSWNGPNPLLIEIEGGQIITLTFAGVVPPLGRELDDRIAALGGSIARSPAGLEVAIPCE